MWKRLPTVDVPLGQGRPKSAGHLNIHPQPRDTDTATVLCRLLYVLVIVKSWKMHFFCLSNVLPLPSFLLLCAPRQNILFNYSSHCLSALILNDVLVSGLCFVTKSAGSHQTHPFIHPVPLCDNLRVNILCPSSHFNSAANPISAIVWWYTVHCCWSYCLMIHTASDHTQISLLSPIRLLHPSRPTTSIIQIGRNRAPRKFWKINIWL